MRPLFGKGAGLRILSGMLPVACSMVFPLASLKECAPRWYGYSVDRSHVRMNPGNHTSHADFVPGSMASRVALVWPLTREAASLSKRHDAERRLQRDVTELSRRER